jgi:hypothetical protein
VSRNKNDVWCDYDVCYIWNMIVMLPNFDMFSSYEHITMTYGMTHDDDFYDKSDFELWLQLWCTVW